MPLVRLPKLGEEPAQQPAPPKLGSTNGEKPPYCSQCCRMAYAGAGFVQDHLGKSARLGFLTPVPEKEDFVSGALSSPTGQKILRNLGLGMEEIAVFHILRCLPHNKSPQRDYRYPTGQMAAHAESACRYHDRLVERFNPDVFVVTMDFYIARQLEAALYLFLNDVSTALELAGRGHRPLLLCGNDAMELVAPEFAGSGGCKAWRGHWWKGSWKWRAGVAQEVRAFAMPKKNPMGRRPKPARQVNLFSGLVEPGTTT